MFRGVFAVAFPSPQLKLAVLALPLSTFRCYRGVQALVTFPALLESGLT